MKSSTLQHEGDTNGIPTEHSRPAAARPDHRFLAGAIHQNDDVFVLSSGNLQLLPSPAPEDPLAMVQLGRLLARLEVPLLHLGQSKERKLIFSL